jgi:hypothetical protein
MNLLATVVLVLSLSGALAASAANVILDCNGFPNRVGGQVRGPGLETPALIPAGAQKVLLENLQAGQTYQVDFYHDTGGPVPDRGSSDFTFVVAADGQGVAAVGLGGGRFPMVENFQPGDRVLKLLTFPIVYNANSGQTASYFIHGLNDPNQLPENGGPQKFIVIPGNYTVDNTANAAAGLEDFGFLVDAGGNVHPAPKAPPPAGTPASVTFRASDEYAEFRGTEIWPRAVQVHFKVHSAQPLLYAATQPATNVVTTAAGFELDLRLPVGGGGLNLWTFGRHWVSGGNVVLPDGKPALGVKRDNDCCFYPLLRYDLAQKEFYFVTTDGPRPSVTGEAEGVADDGTTPLKVRVTATIVPGP